MERAGTAVAKAAMKRLPSGRIVVLSGPGGNGGDGYVAARILADRGWPVRVCALRPDAMTGATRRMAELWTGETAAVTAACVSDADLVVDALFGAGLSRDLDPSLAAMFAGIGVPVIAVDMPSGIDGDTGRIRGGAGVGPGDRDLLPPQAGTCSDARTALVRRCGNCGHRYRGFDRGGNFSGSCLQHPCLVAGSLAMAVAGCPQACPRASGRSGWESRIQWCISACSGCRPACRRRSRHLCHAAGRPSRSRRTSHGSDESCLCRIR